MKIQLGFIALIIFLGACTSSPKFSHELNEELSDAQIEALAHNLTGLSTAMLVNPQQGNCAINDLDIPGEIPRARGVAGGIGITNASYPNMPPSSSMTTPTPVANYVKNVAALYGTASQNTAIMVVDDFRGGPVTLGAAFFELQNESFTTSSAEARAAEIENSLIDLLNANEFSHGALVFNHINALLFAAGYSYEGMTGPDATVFSRGGTTIVVYPVDIEDFDTSLITARVDDAFSDLLTMGFNQVVINMSFALVPCSVRDDFEANRAAYPTFETYTAALQTVNGSVALNHIYQTIRKPIIPDPFYSLIQDPQGPGTYVFVAASGNYGLNYPMYPAAWPEVISASSHDHKAGRSDFSNRGEVMITGAWFSLTDPAAINGGFGSAEMLIYSGTSFSAPAVTVFSAFDLALAVPKCALRTGTHHPDLAYGPPWQNLRLKKATVTYCGL